MTAARVALALTLALAAAAAPAGCLPKPKQDRTRFFVLEPPATPGEPGASTGRLVGLGPVKLPDYLDRNELVERIAPTEIRILDGERWAEPLAAGFTRALARELARRLGAEVVVYPWDPVAPPGLAVELAVERFERGAAGAELTARFVLRDPASGGEVAAGEVRLVEPIAAPDSRAAVAALSVLVARLADAIGAEAGARTTAPR